MMHIYQRIIEEIIIWFRLNIQVKAQKSFSSSIMQQVHGIFEDEYY